MEPSKRTARTAGFFYLIVVLTGIFGLMYIPSKLFAWDNAATTFNNIAASETLFRWGIFSGILCYTAFLLLPLVLYKLLHQVSKTHAVAMAALALVSVPLSLYNLSHKFAVLTLLSKHTYLSQFSAGALQAEVMQQLDFYNNGVQLASVFWGLWLLPFGYLVYRSGFLPKILGVFLMAGCFGYLINFTCRLLIPDYGAWGVSTYIALPATIGEIGICLWLLIVGVNRK